MIGVIDSGIGGLTILNELARLNIGENFVYFRDSKNCPYGNKSAEEIYKIVRGAVNALNKINVKTIVIACNTATAVALNKLRAEFSHIKFIGTEPNIEEPLANGKKNILVLCTYATKNHSQKLKNAEGKVTVLPLKNFASDIENGKKVNYKKMFSGLNPLAFDAVVLGCTHYVFKEQELKQIFVNATFYNSASAVAKKLEVILTNS